MWSIHTMGYQPVIKRNEAPTPATSWMNLKNMMLSEHGQTRATADRRTPLTGSIQHRHAHQDGKQTGGRQGLAKENRDRLLNAHRVSF